MGQNNFSWKFSRRFQELLGRKGRIGPKRQIAGKLWVNWAKRHFILPKPEVGRLPQLPTRAFSLYLKPAAKIVPKNRSNYEQ